jgi:hydrogenase nickel incorporation protein HypA/HybF
LQQVHELSIAESILQRVAAEAERRPGARFLKVGVRVGELSGVDPEALTFGFECLVKDTPWEPMALEIQYCPRMQRCRACQHEFTAPDSATGCPRCGYALTTCVGGDELEVAFLELEEE